jgi:hypothetical protein
MNSNFKPFTGRIIEPTSTRLTVSPRRASSPAVAAARRDDLAVIAERVDALSEIVLKLSKEVESNRRSSRGRRQTKKSAANQLCFDFEGMAGAHKTTLSKKP